MSEPFYAEITIDLTTSLAQLIESSLLPEVQRPTSERSNVTINVEGDILKINVEANDISALRAALNSYLRWVTTILVIVETLD